MLAACLGGLIAWAVRPTTGTALATLLGEASRGLLQVMAFVLDSYATAILRVADGWRIAATALDRLAPLQRALATLFAHSGIELSLALAAVSCAALLWWMRPRGTRDPKEIRHVGVLGF